LLDAFRAAELQHPNHEAILVGLTDDKGRDVFTPVRDEDGIFQVLAGCSHSGSDRALTQEFFEILRQAMRACTLAPVDREARKAVFERFESVMRA